MRRLRAVPPLPGQLALDLPGLLLSAAPAPAASRPQTGSASGRPGVQAGEGRLAPRLVPTRHTGDGPGVPVSVWAVWDGEDLVGVYAEESTARADAAVLQRDAARAGLRGRTVDCLPLQVFTESQHTRRPVQWTPPRPGSLP